MDDSALPRPVVRCLTKAQAAEYLGIGTTLFEGLHIPAIYFGRRCLYDRVDLDAWLDDYKQQGRAGKECLWPVKPGSTDVAIPATGGLQQRYRTASAYAKVLGLETEVKPKPFLPS
ncbi:MAG TPA: helix-turn-helix domain-containing protein [Casimicrobiaceae bacterium]